MAALAYRRAFSLLELLAVLAVIAVLAALLVAAVQQVRQLAAGTQDQNNMKQITLAWNDYASQYHGSLPGSRVASPFDLNASPFLNALPFLDVSALPPYGKWVSNGFSADTFQLFLSPTDPTVPVVEQIKFDYGPTSYAWNCQAFQGRPSLAASFPDGTSNTIGVAQHYFSTSDRPNYLSYFWIGRDPGDSDPVGTRSASFADPTYKDVLPITSGAPPQTWSSVAGKTFQTVPSIGDADGRMLQATQTSGLLVGMFDGSVRTYSPSVSEVVFWAAVTPAGGETGSPE